MKPIISIPKNASMKEIISLLQTQFHNPEVTKKVIEIPEGMSGKRLQKIMRALKQHTSYYS